MALSNVVYNVNVKSKFELFLNEDLCDAEPDDLVKKISEDKKKKELAYKEAKRQKHNEVKKIVPKLAADKEQLNVDYKVNIDKAPRFQKADLRNSKSKIVNQKSNLPISNEPIFEEKNHDLKSKKTFVSTSKKVKGREFDRHSGSDKTGVKSIERRDGSGSYNWGTVKDLMELPEEPRVDSKEDIVEDKLTESDPLEKKEQDKVVMTISEWKALRIIDNVSSNVPTRPANNGENVFNGMNAYQKKVVHHGESDNEIYIPDDDTDSKGRRSIKVNIEFSGRGRRNRESRSTKEEINGAKKDGVIISLDEEEFPTLS